MSVSITTWNEAIDAAMAAIERLRISGASNLSDARFSGQRGADHVDALFDAYQVVSQIKQQRPCRIQRKRIAGWRMPANTVSVTRPGRHGNPYYPGCGLGFGGFDADMRPVAWPLNTNADAVRHFREYIRLMQRDEPARFKALVGPLRGKNLACWCGLDDPCHADVWLEFANMPICEEVA